MALILFLACMAGCSTGVRSGSARVEEPPTWPRSPIMARSDSGQCWCAGQLGRGWRDDGFVPPVGAVVGVVAPPAAEVVVPFFVEWSGL